MCNLGWNGNQLSRIIDEMWVIDIFDEDDFDYDSFILTGTEEDEQ